MIETCLGQQALGGKLNHLRLEKAPSKSTTNDGLRNRGNRFFEALYFSLVDRYKAFLSDNRPLGFEFYEFKPGFIGRVPGPDAMAEDNSTLLIGYNLLAIIAF